MTEADNLSAARAGRVTRAGSRLGRIIRMVRLVRLGKLYSLFVEASAQGLAGPEAKGSGHGLLGHPNGGRAGRGLDTTQVRQSKLGFRLSEYTTRRVIVGVLAMLLLVPLLTYEETDFTEELATEALHRFNVQRGTGWEVAARQMRSSLGQWSTDVGGGPRLVRLSTQPLPQGDPAAALQLDDVGSYDHLRTGIAGEELVSFRFETAVGGAVPTVTEAAFSRRPLLQLEAAYSIGLTTFIIVLLALGSLLFTSDAQALVLRPLEGMVAFVEGLATNPLTNITSKDNTGLFETKVLENSIKKIAGLMRLGLGDHGTLVVSRHLSSRPPVDTAAADILTRATAAQATLAPSIPSSAAISRRLSRSRSRSYSSAGGGGGVLNQLAPSALRGPEGNSQQQQVVGAGFFDPHVPGRTVRAIFMRVRLRDADAIRTVLGRRFMPFLNAMANIVHDTTLAWGGVPHTNTADGWQCVWIINDEWEHMQAAAAASAADTAHNHAVDMISLDSTSQPVSGSPQHTPQQPTRRISLRSFAAGQEQLGPRTSTVPAPPSTAATDRASATYSDSDGNASPPPRPERRRTVGGTPAAIEAHAARFLEAGSQPGRATASPQRRRSHRRHRASTALESFRSVDSGPSEGGSRITLPEQADAAHALGQLTLNSASGARLRQGADRLTVREKLSAAGRVADKALAAAAKIQARLQRSQGLRSSYESQKLRTMLPDFEPVLDISLHVDWAVQGAIGTVSKVEVAYLSPANCVTKRMQTAAMAYGAPILLSLPLFRVLPTATQKLCRRLDMVSFTDRVPDFPRPGAAPPVSRSAPLALYSFDAWMWNTSIKREAQLLSMGRLLKHCKDPDVFNRTLRGDLAAVARRISVLGAADIIEHPVLFQEYTQDLFQTDPDLRSLRAPFASSTFQTLYSAGLALYIAGRWQDARDKLVDLLRLKHLPLPAGDRPTRALLDFMARFGFRAPRGWKGFRLLGPR